MGYERLADFVGNRMRMSHVYQPVMLLTLFRLSSWPRMDRAICVVEDLPPPQVEYYQDETKNMIGRVLRSHAVVEKEARRSWFYLTVQRLWQRIGFGRHDLGC
jgi:ATP adenylyltransferase